MLPSQMLEVAHQRVHLLHVGHGFLRRAHVGLGDDLEQRRAGAVQVDAGQPWQALVQRLAGVLFEVRARDADALLACRPRARCRCGPSPTIGQLVLADLVALRQVRVEVVLAREHRARARSVAPMARPNLHRHAHGFAVQHRQHARDSRDRRGWPGCSARRRRPWASRRRSCDFVASCAWISRPMTVSQCSAVMTAAHVVNAGRHRGRCQSVSCWKRARR